MSDLTPHMAGDFERSKELARRAYVIPLTLGRARIVADLVPLTFYEREFW